MAGYPGPRDLRHFVIHEKKTAFGQVDRFLKTDIQLVCHGQVARQVEPEQCRRCLAELPSAKKNLPLNCTALGECAAQSKSWERASVSPVDLHYVDFIREIRMTQENEKKGTMSNQGQQSGGQSNPGQQNQKPGQGGQQGNQK